MKVQIFQNNSAKTSTKRHHVQNARRPTANDPSKELSKRHHARDKCKMEKMKAYWKKMMRPKHPAKNNMWETKNETSAHIGKCFGQGIRHSKRLGDKGKETEKKTHLGKLSDQGVQQSNHGKIILPRHPAQSSRISFLMNKNLSQVNLFGKKISSQKP